MVLLYLKVAWVTPTVRAYAPSSSHKLASVVGVVAGGTNGGKDLAGEQEGRAAVLRISAWG